MKEENDNLRRILAKLVNNKANSIEFKEAKKQAIDLLSVSPANNNSNLKEKFLNARDIEMTEQEKLDWAAIDLSCQING